MVSSIVGNYLVEKGLITKAQLIDLKNEQQKVHVKLGLIAVSEGLMTQSEADRVNKLQAIQDKRFGDIAVENGYLTEEQVGQLLKKQGNAYLSFAQALENLDLMNVDQLEQFMTDFMWDREFTQSDMADLKSDDADRILRLFIPADAKAYEPIAGMALRTIMRLIDNDVYPSKAYLTKEVEVDNGSMQFVSGTESICCALAGRDDNLKPVASIFGKEDFEKVDMDALDAVGELVNCINGLYASDRSFGGVEMELYPPEYSDQMTALTADEMLVLPLHIKGNTCYFVVANNQKMEMK